MATRDTTTHRLCPVCEGAGEITVNDTNPFGYGPDPQCDEEAPCPNPACDGGWIPAEDEPRVVADAERDARAAIQNHAFVMGHFERLLGRAA